MATVEELEGKINEIEVVRELSTDLLIKLKNKRSIRQVEKSMDRLEIIEDDYKLRLGNLKEQEEQVDNYHFFMEEVAGCIEEKLGSLENSLKYLYDVAISGAYESDEILYDYLGPEIFQDFCKKQKDFEIIKKTNYDIALSRDEDEICQMERLLENYTHQEVQNLIYDEEKIIINRLEQIEKTLNRD